MDRFGYIKSLQGVIRELHACGSMPLRTVTVTVYGEGQLAWDGSVEEFTLLDHPTAQTCYAWGFPVRKEFRYVAVLEQHPVRSAEDAVRAFILSESKKE